MAKWNNENPNQQKNQQTAMAKSQQFSLHASATKKPLFLLKRDFVLFFNQFKGKYVLKNFVILG